MTQGSGRTLLITGATGKTGRHTARLLVERGHHVRAVVHREDDRSMALRNDGAEVVVADMLDLHAMSQAAKGADAAYFVYPIHPGLLEATAVFGQAAQQGGVQTVVNMSQISARSDALSNSARQHWLAERILDWSALAVTHLRPTFFAEWFELFGTFTAEDGVLRLPFADGRHAPITGEDQAHVIAAILENADGHAGQIYPLFGAVELDHFQIADEISRALGRPVRYEPVEIVSWAEELRTRGFSDHLVQHLGNVAVDYRNGVFAGTNDIVETIGGKKPVTVQEFVRKNHAAFAR
jgi:NAD(P)H dehydrogenase (quinone)